MTPAKTEKGRLANLFGQLYFQVVLGVLLGILVGWLFPHAGESLKPLGDGFIKLIKMLLAPIIFGTIVVGIANMGNLKEVGRVGFKALIYFEVLSTVALIMGLVMADIVQPGAGMNADPATLDAKEVAAYTAAARQQGVVEFLMDIIPTSVADAFAKANMLQVILFSILFGLALAQLPDRGRPVVEVIEGVLRGFFGIVRFVMRLAPVGAFGAIAFTVGKYGPKSLESYGRLVAAVYGTAILYIVVALGAVAWLNRFPLGKFLKFIKDEILVTFATATSEAALPRLMTKLEEMGCAKPVVGLVLPAGYAFNAAGSSIYLTLGAVFLAQATNTPFPLRDQLTLLGVCLFTSKGAGGVVGAGFIALAATLASMNKLPVSSLVLLLGVDRFVNEARAVTNLIGNGVATVVIARWEKAFDEKRAAEVLNGKAESRK